MTDIATWHPAFREYLNDSEIAFIEASIREEAARTSEESARHRRRILIRTAAIVVTLVAAIASVAYYLIRPNRLETSHSIAVQAQRAIDKFDTENKEGDQFQLGVLLATEAERVASSSETKALLQSTLSRLPRINSVSPQKENVLQVSITPNGSQILAVTGRLRSPQTISDDRQAKLQTLGGETLGLVSFESFPKVTGIFQLSPDGKYLAIASNQGRSCSVGVHDMSAGNKQVAKIDHKGQIDRIIFSPNSRYIATASQDGTVKVLDLLNIEQTNTPAAVLTHKGTVHAVTFSADSQFIATTGEDFFVRVRPTANMQAAVEDANLGRTAFIISLSPHGEYLATVSLDNTIVRVWQVASRELISTLPHEFVVRAVIFSSDGKVIAAGGSEGNITVWNNPQEPEKLRFTGAVDRLIVSPDGKYLAAIGNSNTARLWSYNDGHYEEAAYLIQSSGFNDLAFNWDSNRIVTAGADNTIRVWDLGVPLSQDLEQNESCSRLTRNLTTEEWKVYLADHLGAYRRTCPDIHQPLN